MKLKRLRNQIDAIDKNILEFLNKRAELTLKIGQLKARQKKGVYVPDREKEIYNKIETQNRGPLSSSALKSIYREVFSGTLSLQKPIKVAYLGPELTFTHLATMKRFAYGANGML